LNLMQFENAKHQKTFFLCIDFKKNKTKIHVKNKTDAT